MDFKVWGNFIINFSLILGYKKTACLGGWVKLLFVCEQVVSFLNKLCLPV